MELINYKLSELIEQSCDFNINDCYDLNSVRGISIKKCFIETKADMENVSLRRYKIVKPESFAYVPTTSRNGGKITIAINQSNDTYIVSSSYEVFYVKEKETLLPQFLFIWFTRPEFDRYARFHSWGSAREVFSFSDMCSITLKLPRIEVQQKIVDIYNSLNSNLQSYLDGISDLKITWQTYIEKLSEEYTLEEIKKYIEPNIEKNVNEIYGLDSIKGISTEKEFIETKANLEDVSLKSYLLVKPSQFAFVPDTSRRGEKIALAYNYTLNTFLISSIYQVFRIRDTRTLLPEYLFLWLRRSEFDRYSRFHSWGSAREVFDYGDMCKVKIPIPPLPIQESIANVYKAQYEREMIADKLNKILKEICPVLIQKSLS